MSRIKKSKINRKTKKPKTMVTKNYHHGDLKNALLDSSIELLKKNGPQAFSLRELSISVGVSSAAPYRHFKTKERLFSALAVRGFILLTEGFNKAIASHPKDPLNQLHRVGQSYYDFAVKYPEHLQMMFGNIIPQSEIAKDQEFGEAAGKAFSALVQVVTSCQLSSALNKKENPRRLAIKIWSAIHGFSTLDLSGTLQGASGLKYNPQDLVIEISKAISSGLNE